VRLESAEFTNIQGLNAFAMYINHSSLVFINFDQKNQSLKINFKANKILAIHSVTNTPYVIIVTENGSDIQFSIFKLFDEKTKGFLNQDSDGSVTINDLEVKLQDSQFYDFQYIP
jgi:hypothetical protein